MSIHVRIVIKSDQSWLQLHWLQFPPSFWATYAQAGRLPSLSHILFTHAPTGLQDIPIPNSIYMKDLQISRQTVITSQNGEANRICNWLHFRIQGQISFSSQAIPTVAGGRPGKSSTGGWREAAGPQSHPRSPPSTSACPEHSLAFVTVHGWLSRTCSNRTKRAWVYLKQTHLE